MTGQDVDLLTFRLRHSQPIVGPFAVAKRSTVSIHSVISGDAFRQCGVHSYDDRLDLRLSLVSFEYQIQPGELSFGEARILISRILISINVCVIHVDDIHSLPKEMKVSITIL